MKALPWITACFFMIGCGEIQVKEVKKDSNRGEASQTLGLAAATSEEPESPESDTAENPFAKVEAELKAVHQSSQGFVVENCSQFMKEDRLQKPASEECVETYKNYLQAERLMQMLQGKVEEPRIARSESVQGERRIAERSALRSRFVNREKTMIMLQKYETALDSQVQAFRENCEEAGLEQVDQDSDDTCSRLEVDISALTARVEILKSRLDNPEFDTIPAPSIPEEVLIAERVRIAESSVDERIEPLPICPTPIEQIDPDYSVEAPALPIPAPEAPEADEDETADAPEAPEADETAVPTPATAEP